MPSSSLIARKLAPAHRVFCAAPDYLRARGSPSSPADLTQHDCLSYGYLSTGMQWKLTGPDGDHGVQVPWKLRTNNAEVLRDAAVRGLGIALLPTFIAAPELRAGKLRAVLRTYHAPELSVCVLYAPTRRLPLKARLFIDVLVERFGKGASWEKSSRQRPDAPAA